MGITSTFVMPSRFVPRQSSDPGVLMNNVAESFQVGVRSVISGCGKWKEWLDVEMKEVNWDKYRQSLSFMEGIPEIAVFFLCLAFLCLLVRYSTLAILTRHSIRRYKKYM